MIAAVEDLTPPSTVDMSLSKAVRAEFIAEAESVGSIPPPASIAGAVKTGLSALAGNRPTILLDKMGERLAFERSGTRLYDALLTKYEALVGGGDERFGATLEDALEKSAATGHEAEGQSPLEVLRRIRSEELEHFKMLSDAIGRLGGDPTAQTPCADVAATAAMGYIQVLTDPRTTLAQCLNVMLSAELTDNAGWELLIQLADDTGQSDLAGEFLAALGEEQQHLAIVRAWLEALLTKETGTAAV
jgi:rubrerythrin